MTAKSKNRSGALTEEEIDSLVESQAEDDEAWNAPVRVSQAQDVSLSIPASLAMRAAFLAKLHREPDAEEWLRRIIKERVELEESAFTEFKRTFARKRRA